MKPAGSPAGRRGMGAGLLVLVALGCGDGGPGSGSGGGAAEQPPDGWEVRELLRFESVETPEGTTPFGSVQGVEVDDDGNVYVLDGQAAVIHVVGPRGEYLRTLGGSGRGPGEFRNPNGLLITPDGRLWVSDPTAMRYTAFDRDGTLAGTYRRAFSAGWGPYWDAVAMEDGTLYEPTTIRDPGTEEILSVFLALRPGEAEMEPVDTVFRPPAFEPERWEVRPMESRSGPMTTIVSGSLPVPFSPVSRDRLDPRGGFWAGDTDALRFVRISWQGDTLATIQNPAVQPRPVRAQDREQVLQEWTERFGEALRPEMDKIPDQMPYWDQVWVDPEGRLWVERFRAPGTDASEPHEWEVYDADGGYLGLLRLPLSSRPAPVLRNGRLVGTVQDELGVAWVVVFTCTQS